MTKKVTKKKTTAKKEEPIVMQNVTVTLTANAFKDISPKVNSIKSLGMKIKNVIVNFMNNTAPTNTLKFIVSEQGLILKDDCFIIQDIRGSKTIIPTSSIVALTIGKANG